MSQRKAASGDERIRRLLMSGLDGEMPAEEREELERLLESDPALEDEWGRLLRLKEVTDTMVFKKPPDDVWDDYWASVYIRLERGIGWVLLSLGAIVLISYGIWASAQHLISDVEMPLYLKVAVGATILGVVVLFVSVLRERLFMGRFERYKDIER
ncbi:MAG: hypothetical protein AMS21_06445 [Gemmatimonas sp. SG8_38_2]|nr:MAG: hypothetical protein AMS21_06445 [Gemmatimonas sp. SG8_38_2]